MFWKRYLLALVVTLVLFGAAFYLSSELSKRKIDEVRAIQDKIATDILSTETRFVLLGSSSCDHVISNDEFENDLNEELDDMAKKVKFMESELGEDDHEVIFIKEQHILLQIKDYLLQKELSERCGKDLTTILYFHGVECEKCQDQSIVLDEIRQKYPSARVYWLDRGIETPAMQTLVSMFKIKDVPTLVIGKKILTGFQSLESLSALMPEEKEEDSEKSEAPKSP